VNYDTSYRALCGIIALVFALALATTTTSMSSSASEATEAVGAASHELPETSTASITSFPQDQLGESPSLSKRRKDLFGDCALVEIIHLHDCLRGALRALERDVETLHQTFLKGVETSVLNELECRVNGRFKVIWSVFRAHSSAEDEFIWPALQLKTQGLVKGSPQYSPHHHNRASEEPFASTPVVEEGFPGDNSRVVAAAVDSKAAVVEDDTLMDQEAYEEDHADEERMFSRMDNLLTQLREGLFREDRDEANTLTTITPSTKLRSVDEVMKSIHDLTAKLSKHLMAHLEKEEKQCMPLVVKHLSKSEIHDLVGQIMGKRSSDMISEIMTMAVQNLNQADRLEMIKYMKAAMSGTFFDKWLSMSGWMEDVQSTVAKGSKRRPYDDVYVEKDLKCAKVEPHPLFCGVASDKADVSTDQGDAATAASIEPNIPVLSTPNLEIRPGDITSQAELEKLIRAVATNPALTPHQKNTTIQGLRDSVWKSNQRIKNQTAGIPVCGVIAHTYGPNSKDGGSAAVSATCVPARRVTPPSIYYQKNESGKLVVTWNADKPNFKLNSEVPLFSASELAPTYHDGATGAVLGCPHYARACKLRHPISGRMYTCRLCCEQEREMPSKDQDEPLDRYAVQEIMCMKCNALQPAEDRCINPDCESDGKPFAKYYCKICHLYDDRPRPVFHCPYCNTCRMGLGLGIDFRHCMRCNACVSLEDRDHRCIPQKLQGSCPICHETLFQSTEPLRGLRCGHVMHMSCFTNYRRGQRYTCPLCMKSMEDMNDYFALLDAAVRMQPMPIAYLSTMSNIYCQDCEKSGQCRYHFVGHKCPHCGSYNTRDLGRVQTTEQISWS
jgi:Zinc-ribbon/CHY zinc finger/Ring finger domain